MTNAAHPARTSDAGAKIALPALRLVQSARLARRLADLLLALLGLAIVAMLFLPWQQSAKGTGKVVAFVPQERQQTVTSPVKGVVDRLGDGLVEGTRIQQGQFILEIQPSAADLVEQLKAQLLDLKAKLTTAEVKATVYGQNIDDFAAAKGFAVQAAQEMVSAAEAKLDAKQQTVRAYQAKERQARVNYQRQQGLFDKGIRSERELESLQKDADVAKAEWDAAQQEATAAEEELQSKQHEVEQKRHEAQTKVDYARAMREDAIGQAATIQKELRDIEIKLGELDRLVITAPRDGVLFRLPIFERGQTLKDGDPLFTIVPDATERAVELWVSGNDTPLIQLGDHVRLQFEGWPAIQFAGWPSVAVGTFGGDVVGIDATDNGSGKFRVLIKAGAEESWPGERYLRQGVRANGWVMLNRVSLGYELWRQLNGFPPTVSSQEPKDEGKDEKSKVKLPK